MKTACLLFEGGRIVHAQSRKHEATQSPNMLLVGHFQLSC